jgi:arylsulfatase A-like enzyme
MVKREGRKPNIIWIFGDQHRGQALGSMGDPNVFTPNLDRMACEGVQFTGAVAGSPLCSPYRGSLLTGQYPHKCVPDNGDGLPEGMPTISTTLRENGYQTCYMGKWHVAGSERRTGGWKKLVPEWQRADWDEWVGYDNNNKQWDCRVHSGFGDDLKHELLDGYETDVFTDMLIARIKNWGTEQAEGEGKPFFAAMSVQPPHSPYVAPEEWMARHTPGQIELRPNVPDVEWVRDRAQRELAGYYAMIENLDWNVGRIRETIAEAGLFENTLVMFFSDHGDMHGSNGRFNKSCPHEESIRIPFIIAGEKIKYGAGAHFPDNPVNHVDMIPTTLGLCGIETPAELPGFDYSGLWSGKTAANAPDSAYLQHSHKKGLPHWRGIVTQDGWKYACMPGQPWVMYNLNDDPYETMNVAFLSTCYPKRRELHARLQQWIDETGDDFTLPELID